MSYATAAARAQSAIFRTFGVPVTYRRNGSEPIAAIAIFTHAGAEIAGFGVPLPELRTRATLPRAGLPEPLPGDRIEQAGAAWIVAEHDPDGSDDYAISLWVRPA